MARLIPIDTSDDSDDEQKTLRLVPIEKKETGIQLRPKQPERTKIDQPLLREANSTSIKDVPEAVLLTAKQMLIDFPLGVGGFIGGATYDAYDALLKGKYSFENARKAHDFLMTASQGAYSKIRSEVPVGDQRGAEEIVNNIFAPLEKFATKGGETVTDLTGNEIAGATAYATLQVLPWVLGAKAVGMGVGGAKTVVEGVTQKNLAPRMTALREAGKDVPIRVENPKQPILDAKAAIIGTTSAKLKEVEKLKEQSQGQQQPNPELQKKIQELKTIKEVNDSLGVVNAGEIPEGKVVDLKTPHETLMSMSNEEFITAVKRGEAADRRITQTTEGKKLARREGETQKQPWVNTTDLPKPAQGAIQSKYREYSTNKKFDKTLTDPQLLDAKWIEETVPMESLRKGNETLWNGKFVPRKSMSKGSIVLDRSGEIIDGNNRVYEALQRGEKEISVYKPVPPEVLKGGKRTIEEGQVGGKLVDAWHVTKAKPFDIFKDGMAIPSSEGMYFWPTFEQAKYMAGPDSRIIKVKIDLGKTTRIKEEGKIGNFRRGVMSSKYDTATGLGVSGEEIVVFNPKNIKIENESNQFTATNNIKESQKSLSAAKDDIIETTKRIADEESKPKGAQRSRRDVIKDAVERANAKRKKEIEDMSHYEDTPDPLMVDANQTIKDNLYMEPSEPAKAVTLQDINKVAKDKDINVNSNIGANGDLNITVIDKYNNKAIFPLGEGGVSLNNVHDFVKNWTDNFAESMKKQYEVKSEVIENAPELVKFPEGTKTRKHIIPSTGETIEYVNVSDLKVQYEARGLPWKGSKKEYYKSKKLDEKVKTEIDDKLTPISQKSLPEIELLDSKGNGKKPGILQWSEPFRFVAQDIEQRTGFPMQQFESKIRDGMRQVNSSTVPYLKRLRESRKGMNYESAVRIYKALEQPIFRESGGNFLKFRRDVGLDKSIKGILGDMTRSEYESAGKIRKILNDAATEYNVPIDKMVEDYAPRMMREGVSGWAEAIKKWQLPEEYNWAALEERSGYMRPHEEQIFKVVDSYIRRGATKRYVGNYLEELNKAANEKKFESKADIDQINKYIATMRGWQTGFDESIRTTGETLARGLNKAINKSREFVGAEPSQRYKNISYKKMDITQKVIDPATGKTIDATIPRYVKTAEEPGFFDIHTAANDLINLHLKLSYAGALAWRPMVWARAVYQSTLSLPIVGPRSFVKGMSKAVSPEAWAESKAATALFQESPVAGGELSRGWTVMDDITQMSTWDTRSGHNVGRHIAYHAGKDNGAVYGVKFLENIKKGISEEKAINKFINDSGADFFHPVLLKNEIIPLLKSKDITSLSERMGLHTVAETQWLYEKGQAPYWARSMTGRVLGQFGVWPSWYIKYVRNLSTKGSKVNIAKRLAGLTAINAISYEIGKEVFGVDISGWTISHPFMWMPLPLQTWDSARKMLGGSDYEKEQGGNALLNVVGMHIPGYLAVKGIINGLEESRDEDRLKRFMGFKPAEPDKIDELMGNM